MWRGKIRDKLDLRKVVVEFAIKSTYILFFKSYSPIKYLENIANKMYQLVQHRLTIRNLVTIQN